MIKAVIIDDEEASINVLKRLIQEVKIEVEIVNQAQSVKEGVEVINNVKPQLVFLDVEMLDGTGFNLLEKFDTINFEVIFITAYDKYAIKAFKYNAIDYLLKPINIKELEKAVSRVDQNIQKLNNQFDQIKALLNTVEQQHPVNKIAIKSACKIDFIEIEEIVCFKAEENYSEVFLTDDRKIIESRSLKHFETLFDEDHDFYRVSRFYIVSLKYVKSYHKNKEEIELKNGMYVPISRRKKKDFLNLLKNEYKNL